jgi:aminopeptidase-like protein
MDIPQDAPRTGELGVTHTAANEWMWKLAEELYPICRSLTGDGVRKTLGILDRVLGGALTSHEVPTGTRCFDWEVPKEWNIRDGSLTCPDGEVICDFKQSNLHVVGYSTPVDRILGLDELQEHLYSLPDQPDLVPYVTSYYKERWGFCLSERQRRTLRPGNYHARIDSTLAPGSLTYAEWFLEGETTDEIFLSTYVCHPSMGNNELSGPIVQTALLRWIAGLPRRRYSYRAVFVPETLGSIVYLSRNLEHLQAHVKAGFNLTCVGDTRAFSFLPSRDGQTLSDRVARHVLQHRHPDHKTYSYLQRGSDERQYCSPGVDLPIASIMRSKYGEYPEYHTSGDDLDFISPAGLAGSLEVHQECLRILEANRPLNWRVRCEPQLGKRGLYPTLSRKGSADQVMTMLNLLAYADGRDLLDLADRIEAYAGDLLPIMETLAQADLLA